MTIGAQSCPTSSRTHRQIVCTLPAGQGALNSVAVVVLSRTSNTTNFAYGAPLITGVVPNFVNTDAPDVLTLSGQNFGTSGTVTIDGQTCAPTGSAFAHTSIQCAIPPGTCGCGCGCGCGCELGPAFAFSCAASHVFVWCGVVWCVVLVVSAGQGLNRTIVVTISSQSTSTTRFSYRPPTITSLVPPNGPTSGAIPITVVGQSLGQYGTVTVGGLDCPPLIGGWSDTQIVCTLPANRNSQTVRVTLPPSNQTSTSTSTVAATTFRYDGPSLSSYTNTGPTAGGVLVTINGASFDVSGGNVTVRTQHPPILCHCRL